MGVWSWSSLWQYLATLLWVQTTSDMSLTNGIQTGIDGGVAPALSACTSTASPSSSTLCSSLTSWYSRKSGETQPHSGLRKEVRASLNMACLAGWMTSLMVDGIGAGENM